MDVRAGSRVGSVLIAVGSLALACAVGYVDAKSSAYITFSIFYLVPVFLATWFANRATGLAVAGACASAGFAADVWPLGSLHGYAYANLCLRLLLFMTAAVAMDRIHGSIVRERSIAEREREAAARLERATEMQEAVMRAVAHDAWEPLSEIRARIVDLQFELATLPEKDARAALNEIAEASRRLSDLVDSLLQEHPVERPAAVRPVREVS